MTATRYPDMITVQMALREEHGLNPAGKGRQGGRPGAPSRNPVTPYPEERPARVIEYSDCELGAIVRMACGLEGYGCYEPGEIAESMEGVCGQSVANQVRVIRERLNAVAEGKAKRVRAGPARLTAGQIERAVCLRRQGLVLREIAAEVGGTMGQVRYVVTGR